MKNAPAALQFFLSQREGDESPLTEFALCGPWGKDAHAKSEFHEFLDSLHVAEVEHAMENDIFVSEVGLDHLRGVRRFAVENVILSGDFLAIDAPCFGPGMGRAYYKEEFVSEKGAEEELVFALGF